MNSLIRFVAVLSIVLGLAACEPDIDLPWIVEVDAWCESTDPDSSETPLPFDIWARVNHDRGPEAVNAVWVDVSFVAYDNVDQSLFLTPVAAFDLVETETIGDWWVTVDSGVTPLDCAYDFEYHFLFSVQDDDGDRTQAEFIN